MKKRFIIFFSMVLTLTSFSAYADAIANCTNDLKESGGHCVYFSGLSAQPSEGRYIKYYMPDINYNLVSCLTSHENLYFIGQPRPGTHTDEFYICTSAIGDQCELVSKDTYAAVRVGNKTTIAPQIFEVKLAAVREKYPACTSSWG